MTIGVGLDVHREQITFDALDTATGEIRRGRIRPAHREGVRRFLSQFDGEELEVALEAIDLESALARAVPRQGKEQPARSHAPRP